MHKVESVQMRLGRKKEQRHNSRRAGLGWQEAAGPGREGGGHRTGEGDVMSLKLTDR